VLSLGEKIWMSIEQMEVKVTRNAVVVFASLSRHQTSSPGSHENSHSVMHTGRRGRLSSEPETEEEIRRHIGSERSRASTHEAVVGYLVVKKKSYIRDVAMNVIMTGKDHTRRQLADACDDSFSTFIHTAKN